MFKRTWNGPVNKHLGYTWPHLLCKATTVHPKSSAFAASGLFKGLKNFAELEKRIAAIASEKSRGDAFEVFAAAWVALFYPQHIEGQYFWPIPETLATRLNIDGLRDQGIDSVLDVGGRLTAVQVKFRQGRPDLCWSELSTFFGLSERAEYRLVIANCYGMAETAAQRERTGFVGAETFDELSPEDFSEIEAHVAGSALSFARQVHREHQAAAIAAAQQALLTSDRARVVMACGTGKTLIESALAEAHSKVLVLVPSLALLRQHLAHWRRNGLLARYSSIVLCSDLSLKRDYAPRVAAGDEVEDISAVQLGVEVAHDPRQLALFLEEHEQDVVVFCTYQSSHLLKQGLPQGYAFDFGAFDEAHRTATLKSGRFAMALDDSRIAIKKRVFFTATQRIYLNSTSETASYFSMDDDEIYGPIAYELSFHEAIARRLIRDYKVIVSVVTKSAVDESMLQGKVDVDGQARSAYDVACHIALSRAMQSYGLKKGIAFFNRTESARTFAAATGDELLYGEAPPHLQFVSSAMPGNVRARRLHEFQTSNCSIMANARCLSEGVDAPSVDFVAFMAPKCSYLEILQIVGRTLRNCGGKDFGYVIVPLFLNEVAGERLEQAVARAGFEDVWDVLSALRQQDERLDSLAVMAARGPSATPISFRDFGERIELVSDVTGVDLEGLREAIAVRAVSGMTDSWDTQYAKLVAFEAEHGHTQVNRTNSDDLSLIRWISWTRFKGKTHLMSVRREKLDIIGFAWEANELSWELMVSQLKTFIQEHGHARVPSTYGERPEQLEVGKRRRGTHLGRWVASIRSLAKRGKLREDRYQQLLSLGFTFEPIFKSRFEKQLAEIATAYSTGNITTEIQKAIRRFRHNRNRGRVDDTRWQRLLQVGMPAGTAAFSTSSAQGLSGRERSPAAF